MTFALKTQLAYGFAALATTAVYAVWLGMQVAERDPAAIDYVGALLWTLGASMLIHALGGAFVRGRRPQDQVTDARDREIGMRADALTFLVFSILAAIPLVLGMLGAHAFWITNVLFFAFALAAVFGVVARVVLYRRG